jgi:hypothetical protein
MVRCIGSIWAILALGYIGCYVAGWLLMCVCPGVC